MTSPMTALRRPRPLSMTHFRRSPSMSLCSPTTATSTSVRWASVVPCTIDSFSPPSAPLTQEQVERMKRHRRQQSQQQNQVQLENDQRYRQQQELHFVLARDRAMLQEQKELWRWQEFSDERVQHRQRHDVRKALDLELQLQQQQIFPHAQPRGGQAHFQFPTSVQMGASRRATMGRPQSISFGSRASEQKMGMATSAGTSASEPAANAGAPQSKRFHALSRPTHSSSRSLDTATLFSITETSS